MKIWPLVSIIFFGAVLLRFFSAGKRAKRLGLKIYTAIFPSVRILIPPQSLSNRDLESWFQLRYPRLELIFGVPEEDRTSIEKIHRLQNRHQRVKVHIVKMAG